jgi:UDP-galactopyranose mutase
VEAHAAAEAVRIRHRDPPDDVTPSEPDHYEYPFPDDANQALYARYRERAASLDRTLVCGRLGEYRYYDMDQAIGRAQLLAAKILAGVQPSAIMEG